MEPFSLRANRLFLISPHIWIGSAIPLAISPARTCQTEASRITIPELYHGLLGRAKTIPFSVEALFPRINVPSLKSMEKVLCDPYNLSRLVFDMGYKKMDFAISRSSPSDYVGAKGRRATESSLPWVREFRGTHFVGCYMMLLKSPRILRLCFLVTFSP